MKDITFKNKKEQPSCWNCIHLLHSEKTDYKYKCRRSRMLPEGEQPEHWCVEWKNNGIKEITQYPEIGFYMHHFKDLTPTIGSQISYLLGNGCDDSVRMVYNTFKEEHLDWTGDFEKDEKGEFKYVTFWRLLSKADC